MLIREARHDDLEAISRLLGETWHATYDHILGAARVADITSRWHSVAALSPAIDHADSRFTVAELDGELCGTALGVHRPDGSILLARIYVHPDRQGRGIGQALLSDIVAMFPGAQRVELEVEPANTGAIMFYERCGFHVTGRGTDCGGTGDGIEHLRMAKELGR